MKVLRLCLLALLSSLAATAQTQPKVVFIGDWLTAGWDMSSNPNWINKGLAGYGFSGQTSWDVAARFQSDVVSLHPDIVHIVVGSIDTEIASPATQQFVPASFANSITTMVAEAKAANIMVILGTTPPPPIYSYNITPLNAWIEVFGAANISRSSTTLMRCAAALALPVRSAAPASLTTSILKTRAPGVLLPALFRS